MPYASFRYDTAKIQKNLEGYYGQADLTDRDWRTLGALAALEIDARTTDGFDAYDTEFELYSDEYAKHRLRNGRNVGTVDLTFEGIMLAALSVRLQSLYGTDGGGALLYFNNAAAGRIAFFHNADEEDEVEQGVPSRKKLPLRRFLDIAPGSELDILLHQEAEDMIAENMKEWTPSAADRKAIYR